MIVIFQGVYLLITTTFDLDFLILGKMSSKLIVLRHLFASAVLTLNQRNIVPCIAQDMPLNSDPSDENQITCVALKNPESYK